MNCQVWRYQVWLHYQPFELNAGKFNASGLVLDPDKAIAMEIVNPQKLESLGYNVHNEMTPEEIADIIYRIFNIQIEEYGLDKERYEKAGHTSMSVGDYVVIYDKETQNNQPIALICAPSGWKKIDNYIKYRDARKMSMAHFFAKLPIDVYEAVHKKMPDEESDMLSIMDMLKYTRCENTCPECGASEDMIYWGEKDYQDSIIFQNANCTRCECAFTEEFAYSRTSADGWTEKRIGLES